MQERRNNMITYEEYIKEKSFIEKQYIDMSEELVGNLLDALDWPESDGGLLTALFLKQHDMKCKEK